MCEGTAVNTGEMQKASKAKTNSSWALIDPQAVVISGSGSLKLKGV